MKLRRALVPFALLAVATAPLAAAATVPALSHVVRTLEARYPGQVTVIELDDGGDRPPHFHVDMRFPASGTARLDVDAATLAIANREPGGGAPSVPLVYAIAIVGSAFEGQVMASRFDDTNGAPAHFDIDVLLPSGAVGRLKVDALSGVVGWRTPAIAVD